MKLPRGIELSHGRYYKRVAGKRVPLSREIDGPGALADALAALPSERAPLFIADLLLTYRNEGMTELAEETQAGYRRIIDRGLIPVFGRMRIDALTSSQTAQFLEHGKRSGRAVAANRERAVLSSAYEFGMRRGIAASNPCRGVRRNKERPRSRYVTYQELRRLIVRSPVQFRDFVWTGALTGMRSTDLCKLRRENLTPEGISIIESKTRKRTLHPISPLLQCVLNRAMDRADILAAKRGLKPGPWVLTNRFGQRWRKWAVSSEMGRQKPGFRFRDIRAKAETDAPGTLGHHGAMLARYTRRETLPTLRSIRTPSALPHPAKKTLASC